MGLARSRDLEEAGVARPQTRRLLEQGVLERVGRGLYALPGSIRSERQQLAEAARRVPGAVFCLLSALRFHRLTNQNPHELWIAINRKAWRPRVEGLPLRIVYLTARAFREGVEEHDVDGVTVRIYSAAKTVADCFKFRNKIGTDLAVEALREFHRQHPRQLEAVWRFAEVDRVTRVLQPYLDSLS